MRKGKFEAFGDELFNVGSFDLVGILEFDDS